jgi:hypothetical protein
MVMKLLSLPCGTHPSHTVTSLCVFVCGTHPLAPFTAPSRQRASFCLVAGSDLHRCSTRDAAALLLLLVPLAAGTLEEVTKAATSAAEESTEVGLLDR